MIIAVGQQHGKAFQKEILFMLRKLNLGVLSLLYLIASVCVGETEVVAGFPRRSELKLAAWNIRILSDSSRTDTELHKIAKTLIDYDFIAISELRFRSRSLLGNLPRW